MEEGQQISFAKEFFELSGVKEIVWSDDFRTSFQAQIPFLYETACFHGAEAIRPWENPGKFLPCVMEEWEKVKEELHRKFSNREQDGVPELMRKGVAFFYECVFWCNHKQTGLTQDALLQLSIKPMNAGERLAFITSRPAKYQSYVQLSELFIELHKLFSKEQVKKKASKP